MMSLEELCNFLKEAGVVEIILEVRGEVPEIEFNGRDSEGDYFKITANNASFAEYGL